MTHIFVSYSRTNSEYAQHLHDDLLARGFDVWQDTVALEPSDHWFLEISRAIRNCAAFVIIKTPGSMTGQNVAPTFACGGQTHWIGSGTNG